jgi:hypothetical protein
MGGRRRLSAAQPRMLGHHDGPEGAAFRRAWRALVGEFGPPPVGSLLAMEMGRVAVAHVNLVAATEALSSARRTRAIGRGRRPSPRHIERLNRRVGLCDGSYQMALDRLRELVAHHRDGHSSLEHLRQRYEAPS